MHLVMQTNVGSERLQRHDAERLDTWRVALQVDHVSVYRYN